MSDLSPEELRTEQRRIRWSAALAIAATGAGLGGAYFGLAPLFTFPEGLASRLAFALQTDVFLALILIVAVQRVSSGRYRSRADNRGSAYGPPSERIAVDAAFLQNTLEQAVIAIIVHLAFASLMEGGVLVLIPAAVLLFGIGRLAFRLGYPRGAGGRAFGMALTVLPSLFGCLAVVVTLIVGWLW